ncbi:WD40/YVTN repeat-like-containing domain,WD40 repeat, conserved site,G-protein beta WD-40 repeat,WD40 [Cinara cedri]|uniref:WD40/YVTN repeat-like-containing domain,WD40 repeat, conserved site,G-protein beta WD-40 repeat,WD40 n=1 Tax=Cinara cedri TaxID=506608 RepID=A0A5E4N4G6_9HEMI|nr:WD40/YVTN repeat-like-containing domain,WD40 repeat, conserved site,G-protein beta WD-40 repeat,WD40 [Cinara cedri]
MLTKANAKFENIENQPILTEATILDPRFKKKAFDNLYTYQKTYEKIKQKVAGIIRLNQNPAENEKNEKTIPTDSENATSEIWQHFDSQVRCWEVEQSGKTIPKAIQSMTMPILDACWNDDGTHVFMASCDKQVKCWDLGSNQAMQVAAHDAPVKTCHWIKASTYACLMTGSWDKTLKFWDLRSSNPIMTIVLPERAYCADVEYPLAVIGTASRGIVTINLEGNPRVLKPVESPLKYQHRCIGIFRDKKKQTPLGIALGSIEGRVAIHHIEPCTKDNFTFKCHRQTNTTTITVQDIYAVNDLKFHPIYGTLVTAGSDAIFSCWDKDERSKVKMSDKYDQPITKCCFNSNGQIFAHSIGYDWSKGHEFNNPAKKPKIFLRSCYEDFKPKKN